MAKLNPVILPLKKLKDNSHKVRISLAHNGETKYIVTDIVISSPSYLKGDKIIKEKNADFLTTKLRKLIYKYQTIIDETDYVSGLTCGELLKIIKNGGSKKRMTINEVFLDYIDTSSLKDSTKSNLKFVWNTILGAMGGDLYIDAFNRFTIMDMQKNLRKKKLSQTTQTGYLNILKTVTNHAIKNDYVVFKKDPWVNVKKPKMQVRECWLSLECLKKLRDINLHSRFDNFWRNVFMLSFYLGGINIADILDLNFSKIVKTGTINYIRQKSIGESRQSVKIEYTAPKEALEMISLIMKDRWYVKFNKTHLTTIATSSARSLRNLRETIGNENLIYYSARKTFSQIAFELGIHSYVIDYILGHSINDKRSSLYNYVFVTPQMATDAIRKVLDFIK